MQRKYKQTVTKKINPQYIFCLYSIEKSNLSDIIFFMNIIFLRQKYIGDVYNAKKRH